ncbi:MAG: hypothetical protein GKR89_28390 [Candidatus Latescibacteria bacterium]|nr:hypothetical protein [Candidatus Latescibacterota bacterium]
MNADGTNQINLTQSDSVVDVWPSFAAGLGNTTLIELLSWGRLKADFR